MTCHRCQTSITDSLAGFCRRCVLLILEEWLIRKREIGELKE